MGPRLSIHWVPVYLFSEPVRFSSVAVGWFFTSMSLMEGKGTSGVADSLSTVRLSLLPSRSFSDFWTQKYAPTLMRGWYVLLISL
jgi:hypothetical protein